MADFLLHGATLERIFSGKPGTARAVPFDIAVQPLVELWQSGFGILEWIMHDTIVILEQSCSNADSILAACYTKPGKYNYPAES